VVAAGAASGSCAAISASKSCAPSGRAPVGCETISVSSAFGPLTRASCSAGSSAPETSAAFAPLCASM
jgi:hypothetical protein